MKTNTPASTLNSNLNLTPAAPKNDGPTTQTEGSPTVNTADGNHLNAPASAGQQAQFTTPVSRRMNTANTPATTNLTSTQAEGNHPEIANLHKDNGPVKPPTNGGKIASGDFFCNDPKRIDALLLMSIVPKELQVNLPEEISARVNHLYKIAIEINTYEVVYRAGFSVFFDAYFASHPAAYSGPALTFCGGTMRGCVNKQQFLADLVACMVKADWFRLFDATKGGLMMWMKERLVYALNRTNTAVTTGAKRIKYCTDPISAAADLNELENLKKAPLTDVMMPSDAMRLVDEAHRKDVERIRTWLAKTMTYTATRRRELLPKIEAVMQTYGITKREVDFPKSKPRATK